MPAIDKALAQSNQFKHKLHRARREALTLTNKVIRAQQDKQEKRETEEKEK
jgi:hypothetical protein